MDLWSVKQRATHTNGLEVSTIIRLTQSHRPGGLRDRRLLRFRLFPVYGVVGAIASIALCTPSAVEGNGPYLKSDFQ